MLGMNLLIRLVLNFSEALFNRLYLHSIKVPRFNKIYYPFIFQNINFAKKDSFNFSSNDTLPEICKNVSCIFWVRSLLIRIAVVKTNPRRPNQNQNRPMKRANKQLNQPIRTVQHPLSQKPPVRQQRIMGRAWYST